MGLLKQIWKVSYAVYLRFNAHDAWAIASHVALSALLALFPFLIVVTALCSLVGTPEAANEVVGLVFEGWPSMLADPLSAEVTRVLTGRRVDILTIGVLLLVWTSSSAVEAMRVALVRAYGLPDMRSWYWTRLQSIGFMLLGAAGMLLLSVTVVLWNPIWEFASHLTPPLRLITGTLDWVRYGGTGLFLVGGLILAHLWLPPQRISIICTLPGTLLTMVLWLLSASMFGFWLSGFANYASTYAGLGSIMAVIFFLYLNSVCFILGGELNAVLLARSKAREQKAARAAEQQAKAEHANAARLVSEPG
ncbi:YihY/virulence factor BrkB family protein [Terrihabitans rhizophilus]|uniref:YihY/virulence factor BrkB family protein n=1 Tax=Terrihabitans rhizophilus TaxID=3092662 RepID=UPI0029DE5122|nr:YihY/virulence factor BrkB family protein [Terrihabitans sp. PJ23]